MDLTQEPTKTEQKPRSEPTPPVPEGMSKSAWKRLIKKQKHEQERDQWVAMRREKRREQKVKRRAKEKENKIKQVLPGDEIKRPVLAGQQPSGVGVYIDCSFDDMMKEGEVISLSQQIIRCYAQNKRAVKPVDLEIYGLEGELLKRFEGPIRNQHLTWQTSKPKRISFHNEAYGLENKEDLVYLSSDSENVIESLEPGKNYIIGGIVDKGRYKNLCNDKAKKQGLVTGRLPIEEYIKISGRKVLTCNHVFEILLKFLETNDWKTAFEQVLPVRKLDNSKAGDDSGEENGKEEYAASITDNQFDGQDETTDGTNQDVSSKDP